MAKKKVFQISNALAEGLEETITAVHHYSGEMHVEIIPIKRIEVDPDNPRDLSLNATDVLQGVMESDPDFVRKAEELTSLQTIAHSIREQGVINPIIVYKYGDKYRLVAGERRTLGSLLAGKAEIQAKILESKPNELKIRLLQWIENIERADLSLWERLQNLEKISAAYAASKNKASAQITMTELSQLLGCTKPHALNYKAVLAADDELKQLIRANKIKNLEKAALLANIDATDIRDYAVSVCLTGAPLKKLRAIVEQQQKQAHQVKATLPATSKRGRTASAVNLGTTKNLKVAKMMLESICKDPTLSPMATHFKTMDWNDYKIVTETFQAVVKQLETLHT